MPLLGYGKYPNVITSMEFERLILAAGPTGGKVIRQSDGKKPHKIVFIQCVGSRDKTHYAYCCNFGCMYTFGNMWCSLKRNTKKTLKSTFFTWIFAVQAKATKNSTTAQGNKCQLIGWRVSRIDEDHKNHNLTVHSKDTKILDTN